MKTFLKRLLDYGRICYRKDENGSWRRTRVPNPIRYCPSGISNHLQALKNPLPERLGDNQR